VSPEVLRADASLSWRRNAAVADAAADCSENREQGAWDEEGMIAKLIFKKIHEKFIKNKKI
jgi:hypothetical protein